MGGDLRWRLLIAFGLPAEDETLAPDTNLFDRNQGFSNTNNL